MTAAEVWELAQNPPVLIAGLAAVTLLLLTVVWLVQRVRALVRSERPDQPLSNLGMLVGFGWSSEAVWVLTGPGAADLITPIRIALFCVFELILVVFMIRAKRNVRLLGHPGRAGKAAWVVATGMSLVAVWTAHNPGEAFLRLLVPLLLTAMWWDGLVGEGATRREDATSWRWTPRRLLLWLGAIEPGERDVETVHRERLTQQMTRLEFDRRHTTGGKRDKAARKLAQLTLTADDAIVTEVCARVDRASRFEATDRTAPQRVSPSGLSAGEALSLRAAKIRHHRTVRTLRVTHPRPNLAAGQPPVEDPRTKGDIDTVIRLLKTADPLSPQARIAHLARTNETRVSRVLRQDQKAMKAAPVNGRRPELEGADS